MRIVRMGGTDEASSHYAVVSPEDEALAVLAGTTGHEVHVHRICTTCGACNAASRGVDHALHHATASECLSTWDYDKLRCQHRGGIGWRDRFNVGVLVELAARSLCR